MNNSSRTKILVVMSECPYPPYSGGKVDFFHKLRVMKESGYEVYLVYAYSNSKDDKAFSNIAMNYVSGFVSFPRKKDMISLVSLKPYVLNSSRPNKEEEIRIERMLKDVDISKIIVDHLFSHYIGVFCKQLFPSAEMIHRMHNKESVFLYSLFKTFKWSSLKKWVFGLDAIKLSLYENSLYKQYDKILSISKQETVSLTRKLQSQKIEWVPPFFDFNPTNSFELNLTESAYYEQLKAKFKNRKIMLLTGSFNAGFNVKSTEWFLSNILPKLISYDNSILFVIAGFESDKYFQNSKHVFVIPSYESVKPLMKIADLSIILATGKGGVKLKLMEALNYRKKIVSTVDGVYGSGFELLIPNTDDPDRFYYFCKDALSGQIDYLGAYSYFTNNFDCKSNLIKALG